MKSLIFVSILILNVFITYSATEPVIKIYLNEMVVQNNII